MTLQPSADEAPAVEETKKIRPLLAWGLLGVNAMWLLIAIEAFLFEGDGPRSDFSTRALLAFGEHPDLTTGFPGASTIGLVGFAQIGLPLLAVLLLTHVRPVLPNPKQFLITALIEYGISAVFGLVAFIATFTLDGENRGRPLTETVFMRVGLFALLGLAALVVWKAAAPYLVRPAGYGALPYGAFGQPGGWPQQPGQPGWPQQGQPGPSGYAQPQGYLAPPPPGFPGQPTRFGQQQPGQPYLGQQVSGPPQQAMPSPGGWPQQYPLPQGQSGHIGGQPQQDMGSPTAMWPQQPAPAAPQTPTSSAPEVDSARAQPQAPATWTAPEPQEPEPQDQSTQVISAEQRQEINAQSQTQQRNDQVDHEGNGPA